MNSILKLLGINSTAKPDASAIQQAAAEARDARRELSRTLEISTKLANSVTELIQSCDIAAPPRRPVRHSRNKLAH